MMEKSQLEKIVNLVKEMVEKSPPEKDRLKATLLSGQAGESYYVVCVAATGNEDVAGMIYNLLEYMFSELARRLEGEDDSSPLYSM